MPAFGLLRRREQLSDQDLRRTNSLLQPEHNAGLADGRASEQIPRKSSPSALLSPSSAANPINPESSSPAPGPRQSLESAERTPLQAQTQKHRRFSMLKFRHASDSQLSTRARQQAEAAAIPPMPNRKESPLRLLRSCMVLMIRDVAPSIITTAPTFDQYSFAKGKLKTEPPAPADTGNMLNDQEEAMKALKKERRKTFSDGPPPAQRGRVTFEDPERPVTQGNTVPPPPAYGDEASSALALPVNRLSESSRSDGSSADHGVYATTTTTTHTVHTTTTFFRLPRRKTKGPLFPLPEKVNPAKTPAHTPKLSQGSSNISSSSRPAGQESAVAMAARGVGSHLDGHSALPQSGFPSPSTMSKTSLQFPPGSPLARHDSNASGQSSPARQRATLRGRASTSNSLTTAANTSQDALPTPTLPSARTSISTGRKSLGDLFHISSRLGKSSEPYGPGSSPATPGSNGSKNNSMQLAREPAVSIVLPERLSDDTPAKYLERLEEVVSRGLVASVLSKGTDPFSQAVLRSYMRSFGFFGDPMDMAIRKLLMEVELPKETQQIDRCLQAFANRYHECNPGIFHDPGDAYFIAFSLLILHTDVFNQNNKKKMQKQDYLKNTKEVPIFDDILECFYDNISYTPFIHVEDDFDINGERIIPQKMKKKSSILSRGTDPLKRSSKEPIDPYALIMDSKLDTLRPNLKEVMFLDEHYSYLGTVPFLNLQNLRNTFFNTGVLQIVSARSRPDAFMSEKTATNPEQAHVGIVDIKVTKVGLLWRKDPKKKKTRSPWQEWGAILTGAQLYFFRNTGWTKNLVHQYEQHIKHGNENTPVVFKPPLDIFKPDAMMSTDDAVALVDANYKKHKNAFIFVRRGGLEETFLADNEEEMNDWLGKLNYAAAFRSAGVRMRGLVGGNYEGQRTRGIRRLDSSSDSPTAKTVQTPTGDVNIVKGNIDTKMARDIQAARRAIMARKIKDSDEKLAAAQKQLDTQLRNARHLQILAPIQEKTRDQLLSAAARMSAKLKWLRVEIWRLRCHRDILSMDMEEESKHDIIVERDEVISPPRPVDKENENDGLSRMASKASNGLAPQISPISSHSSQGPGGLHPSPQPSSTDGPFEAEDMFSASSALSSGSSFHRAPNAWELPPLDFNNRVRRVSSASIAPSITHQPSGSSMRPITAPGNTTNTDIPAASAQSGASPQEDAAELAVLEQAGVFRETSTPDSKLTASRSMSVDGTRDKEHGEKDRSEGSKIRRSLHRTLRDAHVTPGHHQRRSRGKDSLSSVTPSDDNKGLDDMLSRGTGSFVVHGKKASVITFGSELQQMTPEDRLRFRKSSNKDDVFGEKVSEGNGPAGFEDYRAVLAGLDKAPIRRDSGASASTATARSFHELRRRMSENHATATGGKVRASLGEVLMSDEDDSDAEGPADGRTTPSPQTRLPDGETEEGGDTDASPDQRAFYTPESASPVRGTTSRSIPAVQDEGLGASGITVS